jgi:HK97 family phage major capsid protein
VNPRISPRLTPGRTATSSFEEYRARLEDGDGYVRRDDPDSLFWRYVMAPANVPMRRVFSEEEYRVLNKTTTTAGGFLVPTELESQVVAAARAASAIAQLALELTTESGDTMLLPTRSADAAAVWTAESVGYTLADLTFGQTSLSAFKSATLVKATEELTQDSGVPFDEYLAMELGGRLGDLQDAAFCTGSGTGQPLGIVNASSTYTVSTAATGSSLLFKPADILQFFKALAAPYRPNASWIVAADDFASLAASADTAGGLVFPSLQNNLPTLYGRPVYISPNMPAPAANAKSLAFGRWDLAYCIRRVRGVGVERLDELYAENGQVGYKGSARVDGRPTLAAAAIIGAHSAT